MQNAYSCLEGELSTLGLGWLLLIGNPSALLLHSKVQKIKPSLFRVNINVPGISYDFCFPTLMILQLMGYETTVQGLTQQMSAVEITHYGLASPTH